MKKLLFCIYLIFVIKIIYAQEPIADFDYVVEYHCNQAFVGLVDKSTNSDSVFWDLYGNGNFVYVNNPTPPIGNLTIDKDFVISMVAKRNNLYDTITKIFNLRQSRARFEYKINDSLQFAPLSVEFINNSQQANGDSLTFLWEFGDGDTSTLKNPTHIYRTPKTYYPRLTATTQHGCESGNGEELIVKDTLQRDEFDFITSGCIENGSPVCGYENHFIIENDTLKLDGFYSGNCCTHKTATLRNQGDTIFIRTFETGLQCTCGCGYCFSINVPNIHKDSVIVSFDGKVTKAKSKTSIVDIQKKCSFEIYPNPIENDFTLFCNELTNQSTIEIIDLLGKTVFTITKSISAIMVIPCSNLKSGIYILKVNIDRGNYLTKRILINNL